MSWLERCKISVNKRILLLLAGFLWSSAGFRVLSFGYDDLFINSKSSLIILLWSLSVFLIFYLLIFSPMVKKHTYRIMSSSLLKHCIFSFLDLKGYGIMIVMMVGGITLRNAHVINPLYLGSFYLGLGSALLSAGIKVLISFTSI